MTGIADYIKVKTSHIITNHHHRRKSVTQLIWRHAKLNKKIL